MGQRRKKKQKETPVIAVLNMKGGVGKTTITANVFREYYKKQKTPVVIIDFDPQFNLSQLLLTENQYDFEKARKKTIFHAMNPPLPDSIFATSSISATETAPISVHDYTRRLKYLRGHDGVNYDLVLGDFRIAMLNLHENSQNLEMPKKRFSQLIMSAKENYGVVVIDCNPSSSFLTRCALEVSTHLLIPVKPDKYSILGVQMIMDYIEEIPSLPKELPYSILMNDIYRNKVSDIEQQLRQHKKFGRNVLVSRVPRSTLLAARSDYSGFATDLKISRRITISQKLASVADEIAARI